MEWTTPTNVHISRSFLELATYYRRFIYHFAHLANPLHRLTRKGIQFIWTINEQSALNKLK